MTEPKFVARAFNGDDFLMPVESTRLAATGADLVVAELSRQLLDPNLNFLAWQRIAWPAVVHALRFEGMGHGGPEAIADEFIQDAALWMGGRKPYDSGMPSAYGWYSEKDEEPK